MKKSLLFSAVLFITALNFISCTGDEDDVVITKEVTITSGVFVLNEGNYYNNISGSLSYISYTSAQITNELFKSVNNRSLGGTPNSAVINQTLGEMYIACTDENRVEVVNSQLTSTSSVSITQPREMVCDDDYVYVTSYDGTVSKIQCSTNKVVAKTDVIGACLEGIAIRGDYLYVCNAYNADYTYNTNVVKVDKTSMQKVSDIQVACNPTTIKTDGTNLYVLSTGNYADVQSQIQKIDALDAVSYICDGTLFDVYNSKLYVINSVTDWTTYTTTTEYFRLASDGTKTTFYPICEVPAPCAIGVDPNTGYIVVSSYSIGATGYTDYSSDGQVFIFDYSKERYFKFNAGVGPCTLLFNQTKTTVEQS